MPKKACHGLAEIQEVRNRQLSTRPESTPSVAEKRYSADAESRSQYISANAGKTFQVSSAAAATNSDSTSATLASGTRLRLSQTSTAHATPMLINDDREYESTSAAKNT